jgi:DNA excision repair protein ERCC-5
MFALLLGSDYTDGVKGIGLVNAMEILKAFSSFDELKKFREWAMRPDVLQPTEQTTAHLMASASPEER